ncbi:MAG: AAA family ATPase [Candidatus Methanogranum gryphiswaldense]|nr:MAG: AAA family ATPase [Candidatus Methanogranum sp. U3.2.1]
MSEKHERIIYPFSAIVGQEKMKMALILNAVNPSIGGVLIRGERGTAKSTAVRSLAALLPKQDMVVGCPFGCDPNDPDSMCESCRSKKGNFHKIEQRMRVVELPVSATEDKVVGTLDISAAIKNGEKKFEPGILAEANRNILYVDEVNLLNDHIVDVLLDSAAMGINTVEREGISFSHPSKFILIGTMNPEEGDLRPQLLDRFGLCVNIEGISDPDVRLEIIKRKMVFDENPLKFRKEWESDEKKIESDIVRTQKILSDVKIDSIMLRKIVDICIALDVDGHRGDIAMMKVSKTLAAYENRTEVEESDIRRSAEMVLLHRMRKTPFSETRLDGSMIDKVLKNEK